jgi:hypothetical protein
MSVSLNGSGQTILQVVQGTTTTNTSTTSTTYVNTSLSATITPFATTSKILIIIATQGSTSVNNFGYYLAPFRGGASGTNVTGFANGFGDMYGNASLVTASNSLVYIDSPSTTSATTYYLCIKTEAGNTAVIGGTGIQTITLMEISGA